MAGGREHVVVGSRPGRRGASGCHQIRNVTPRHAREKRVIKPVCGPATKTPGGEIRWLELRWRDCARRRLSVHCGRGVA